MRRFLMFVLFLVLALSCSSDFKKLPDYYDDYLDEICVQINELKSDQADGFIFWTDPHYPENAGNTATIIDYIQKKTGKCLLFCGGDATQNAPSYEPGLAAYTALLTHVGRHGLLCPIRGNHDFTSSTSRADTPQTMDKESVYDYLSSFRSSKAVVDTSECCPTWFYVDSPKGKIRYVVFDSSDTINHNRIRYGMSEKQLSWIFDTAVATVPQDWKIIFLSHIPFAPDHTNVKSQLDAGARIAGLDNVLMCISGHRHSDMESGIGGLFQVLTAADCLLDVGRTLSPYSKYPGKKALGTVNEQTLDYVSISKDYSKVTMKRIGYGHDRIFNVCPRIASVGDVLEMKASMHPVQWFAFDAQGNETGKYGEDGLRNYNTSHLNASISEDGHLTCLRAGYTIVVALHEDGTKEYYMIEAIDGNIN